jgi:hypothetical protein
MSSGGRASGKAKSDSTLIHLFDKSFELSLFSAFRKVQLKLHGIVRMQFAP